MNQNKTKMNETKMNKTKMIETRLNEIKLKEIILKESKSNENRNLTGITDLNGKTNTPLQAQVCEIQRELYTVISERGITNAKLRGSFYKENSEVPVVGDMVELRLQENGYSVIERLLERKSKFSRTDLSGHAAGYVKTIKEQVLAANFDYVFIVDSLNQNFNQNRITRYVSSVLKSGAEPIVVLTKADLCENVNYYIQQVKTISNKLNVYAISSMTGEGLEQLSPYLLRGNTVVFLGSSGVGKSTLLNAIAGEELMKTGEIRERDSRGRHTTTHRKMIFLPSGVRIIDTPGIRELGLWDAEEGIEDTFSDIIELFQGCRFANCTHTKEIGCAVQEALANESISQERWKLYSQLKNENEWARNKATSKLRQKQRSKGKRLYEG